MTSTTRATFEEIAAALQPASLVLVASHVRPDGDALGSTIALALWLRQQGKRVIAWNEDGMPEKFRYLPCNELVSQPSPEPISFDAVIAVDTSTRERLGTVLPAVASAGVWINIDHHVSNPGYGDLNHIDPSAPASGQIVMNLLETLGAEITPDIAANLFAAISTDTGSFQYPATTAETLEAAARLVRAGVDVGRLSQSMYESYPLRRLELLRELLNVAVFSCGGRLASFGLTRATAERVGAVPEDNEGLIDHLRSIETVVAAVFFEELTENSVRVSMRSKNADVADVRALCALFGGGGHPLAAGARVRGTLEEVTVRVLKAISDEIRKHD